MLEMRSTISSEVAGMASVRYVVTLTGDEREDLLAVVDRGRAPATQTRCILQFFRCDVPQSVGVPFHKSSVCACMWNRCGRGA